MKEVLYGELVQQFCSKWESVTYTTNKLHQAKQPFASKLDDTHACTDSKDQSQKLMVTASSQLSIGAETK